MATIEIEGMEFYAYHGHFKQEQIVGNKFIVNVSIDTDASKAVQTDHLTDALDYQKVYNLIKVEMNEKSHLLEHICGRIIDSLYKEFNQIERAVVKVSKMNPPMGGQIEKVSVTLSRSREENLRVR
jgi:7,8-dihydroneopterin aldolase/epimerase/oxygenase